MDHIRKYGVPPFTVAVIHGGPGASGEMASVAQELARVRGTLEPLQTSFSVEGQVRELLTGLNKHGDLPVTLIGHSWGAWLSFIFAAHYPLLVRKLILVGSPPFEEKFASKIMETRLGRLDEKETLQVHCLKQALSDPNINDKDVILSQFGSLMSKADSFDPLPDHGKKTKVQLDIFQKVWAEASEWRKSGKLLGLGKQIQCPVVTIHGDYDPHPWEGVEKPLSQMIEDFRFILLKKCGHTPWKEKYAKDAFCKIIEKQLT
ncbi:alpha/beta hydrolase [Kroppenstedtia pulmonis]|uniref:Alpha/beta hydrolase n=1 Tax=Kroppenstedtia pulmonis TaxID=1380685 RepID=A0A7D4BHB9_9BACL|nr:alpha/beta hydrolase [Kroppenstedtia pulmonis]QKG84395.1 alpha/beta hydrolase [Kroppenstedtia pulmonis]